MARLFKYVGVKTLYPDSKVKKVVRTALTLSAKQAEKRWQSHETGYSGGIGIVTDIKDDSATIGTDDQRVDWVDKGTKPHTISGSPLAFPDSYQPATKKGRVSSTAPVSGVDIVFAYRVRHPGVKARKISELIAVRLQPIVTKIFDRAMSKL